VIAGAAPLPKIVIFYLSLFLVGGPFPIPRGGGVIFGGGGGVVPLFREPQSEAGRVSSAPEASYSDRPVRTGPKCNTNAKYKYKKCEIPEVRAPHWQYNAPRMEEMRKCRRSEGRSGAHALAPAPGAFSSYYFNVYFILSYTSLRVFLDKIVG